MSPSSDYKHAFIGAMIQSAGADFLASFSELLRASSLLERRPDASLDNPDIDRSLRKAQWLVGASIETFHRLVASLERPAGAGDAYEMPKQGELSRLIAAAVEQGILIESPPAARLVTHLLSSHDARQVVLTFAHELRSCREALDRIDIKSKPEDFAFALQAALSTYASNLIKGQYVAYANRVR